MRWETVLEGEAPSQSFDKVDHEIETGSRADQASRYLQAVWAGCAERLAFEDSRFMVVRDFSDHSVLLGLLFLTHG